MVIALILFVAINQWLERQARIYLQSTDFQSYLIWMILSGLAIGALLCALSWLTLLRSRRSYPISLIFITVGSIVYAYPFLYLIIPHWFPWLSLPYISSYTTPFPYTGIFIGVIGFLHLFLPNSP